MSEKQRKLRVLLAKAGLDGHDRGIKIVAQALRDAGIEVIYTGLHLTPEEVAKTALQESVDVIGLSFLSGAHMTLVPEIIRLLESEKIRDQIEVVLGGFMPEDDEVEYLKNLGVKAIFGSGSRLSEIVEYFSWLGKAERRAR